ncbi:hypothetical protein ACIOBK_33585 [Micromonospora chokoriensis]
MAWVLALDFDPKGHQHDAAAVTTHAADAARLFTQLGGRPICDVAASGGRHVWIPLAVPITVDQARQLARACRRLWPTLDISSAVNANEGCLTAPGSPCKDASYRRLTTPLPEAYQAVTSRSAPDLITRALVLLNDLVPDEHPTATTTHVLQAGGPRPLSPLHTQIAEHGVWPADHTTHDGRPWTRSEACYAVLCAAATRGHSHADVLHNLDTGRWAGLLTLYTGRYGPRWRRRLTTEWAKAQQAAALNASTHPPQATPNTGGAGGGVTDRDFVRRWLAVVLLVVDQLADGRQRHNARVLLWGMAWLGWRVGRRYVEAGTRSYSRACAGIIDHTTAAAILRHLRDLGAEQAVVRRVSAGRGTHGDLYELVIPPALQHLATDPETWPNPRPIPAVFGVRNGSRSRPLLGATGWRIHQALTAGATGTAPQIAVAAGVSRSETYNLLPELVRLGLATAMPGTARPEAGCWGQGPTTVQQAGEVLDAPAHLVRLDARHRRERSLWRKALDRFAARRRAATPQPDEPLWWPPDWAAGPPGHSGEADTHAESRALAVLANAFDVHIL